MQRVKIIKEVKTALSRYRPHTLDYSVSPSIILPSLFFPSEQGSSTAGPNLVLVLIHNFINKGNKSASEPERKLLAPDFYFYVMITG